MRNFYTAVVELYKPARRTFDSEPYECGWASEAQFFVTAESSGFNCNRIELRIQVSPDGIHWVDEGTAVPTLDTPGMKRARVTQFGGWLRVVGTLSGGAQEATLTIHLALKE